MKKKLFALLLTLAMVMALFAGCGSKPAEGAAAAASEEAAASVEKPAASADTETPADEAAAEASAATAASAEEVDSGIEYPQITYPLTEETKTLTYWQAWPPFLNEISAPQDAAMYGALEEATGVHLEITAVSTENESTDFMLMCSGGDLLDMIQKGYTHYSEAGAGDAIEDEMMIDLLPYLEEYSANYYRMMMEDRGFYNAVVDDQGRVPSLIGMYKDPYYTDQGMWIRKDILDETGLDIPTTVDELDEVLMAFKNLGLTDPLVVLSEGNSDFLATAYGCGDRFVDGKIVNESLGENGKAMMLKLHEYYEKGLINHDFISYTSSNTKPDQSIVLSDNAGMFNEDVASIAGYKNMSNNPTFDLEPVGQIRLTPDQKLNTGFIGQYAADKYSLSISANCEDVELAIQYMDYLFSDEGFVMANYGIEDYTYTVEADGSYAFTDLILANERGFDWQLCQSLYINPGFPCLNDLAAQELTYNEAQKAAVPTWVAAYDSSDETVPNSNWLSYMPEETARQSELKSDLDTYQEEVRLKFITGQMDIEAEWDNYVATCMEMGYEELQEITQSAVERYLSK